ncbi:hypothetical protein MMC07_007690 [Pseudocyphellaria aurata]|nr:hypothetical protein [Pseudocyphellaria aurata]
MNTPVFDDIDIDSPFLGERARTSDAGMMKMTLSWCLRIVRAISKMIKRSLPPFSFAAWYPANDDLENSPDSSSNFLFGSRSPANTDLESRPGSSSRTILFTSRSPANNNLATTPLPFRLKGPISIPTFSIRPQVPAQRAQALFTRPTRFPPPSIDIVRAKYGPNLGRYVSDIEPGPSGEDFPSSMPSPDSCDYPSVQSHDTVNHVEELDAQTRKLIYERINFLSPRPYKQY